MAQPTVPADADGRGHWSTGVLKLSESRAGDVTRARGAARDAPDRRTAAGRRAAVPGLRRVRASSTTRSRRGRGLLPVPPDRQNDWQNGGYARAVVAVRRRWRWWLRLAGPAGGTGTSFSCRRRRAGFGPGGGGSAALGCLRGADRAAARRRCTRAVSPADRSVGRSRATAADRALDPDSRAADVTRRRWRHRGRADRRDRGDVDGRAHPRGRDRPGRVDVAGRGLLADRATTPTLGRSWRRCWASAC